MALRRGRPVAEEQTILVGSVIPVGTVAPFKGGTVPTGWLLCDGLAVSRTTYAALYDLIGTSEGIGDGSTTFNLPDLRGYFIRGKMDVNTLIGSGSAASNNATFTAHGINRTGFKVRLASGTLSGLSTNTDYYAIVVDANTLAFATSFANAIIGTKIVITGANTAIIAQYEDPDKNSRTAERQEDAFQGHYHQLSGSFNNTDGAAAPINYIQASSASSGSSSATLNNQNYVNTPRTDGTNGVTRTASETRPRNVAMNYIIKY